MNLVDQISSQFLGVFCKYGWRGLLTDWVQHERIGVKGTSIVLSPSNCKDGAVIY